MSVSASVSHLHVTVDCRVVSAHFPGIGRATLETVRALTACEDGPRLSLLVDAHQPPSTLTALAGRRVQLIPVATKLRAPADQWALPLLLRRLRPDIYHASYYAIPAALPGRVVVTIYDLIPRLFPAYWPNPVMKHIINAWTAYAARRADRVMACSESTARDIARLLPAAARKVRVARLGVTAPASRASAGYRQPGATGPGTPYLLYVGSNKPHKNLPRLVAAFARVAPEMAGDLVIAGAWDEHYPQAMDLARRRGLADRVRVERRPTDQRLDELFAGATAFVFPSLYEGFGLPVLEAMAAGLPVATGDRGSLKEVAGDAALLFDPTDEGALAAALRRLLRDEELRARLAAAGPARAALFPWSRTAEGAWQVYAEAARIKQSTRHRRRQGAHRRRQGA